MKADIKFVRAVSTCILLSGFFLPSLSLRAEVRLPAIFSDHMVLQRAASVPVWGWASPAEAVSVRLEAVDQAEAVNCEASVNQGETADCTEPANQGASFCKGASFDQGASAGQAEEVGGGGAEPVCSRVTVAAATNADAEGRWQVRLNLEHLGAGPHRLHVQGENTLTVHDVLVGQVWLASGQSNMGWRLSQSVGGEAVIKAGGSRGIREFRVGQVASAEPLEELQGQWVVAHSDSVGRFSAVAYFFAEILNAQLRQPVGIIHSSWGGSAAEAWISAGALGADTELAGAQRELNHRITHFSQLKDDFIREAFEWMQSNAMEDAVFAPATEFYGDVVDASGWEPVDYNYTVTAPGLPKHGVIWLRQVIDIPAEAAGHSLVYQRHEGHGLPTIYWNSHRVDGPEYWTKEDLHTLEGHGRSVRTEIPAAYVKAGRNVLAMRFYAPFRAPGRVSWQNTLSGAGGFSIRLNSGWQAKAEAAFTPEAAALESIPEAFKPLPAVTAQPARLYNAMIAPLVPYRIAGVLWYQGETNVGRAAQYRTTFPLLIADWRTQWAEPALPFYFCQLPNFDPKRNEPVQSEWAELREAQSLALRLPHTGQAVLIDSGEADDVHPRNKRVAGERLALHALASNYGYSDRLACGPEYESKAVAAGRIYLRFRDAGQGSELVARELGDVYLRRMHPAPLTEPLNLPSPDSPLQGFAICGDDGKWVWANAQIEDDHTVVVWSESVSEPAYVRYAWAHNPTCNLYNKAGLPAAPFRTDDFTLRTENVRY